MAFVDAFSNENNRVAGPLQNFVPGGVAPGRGGHGKPDTVPGFSGELLAYCTNGVSANRDRLLEFDPPRRAQASPAEKAYMDILQPMVLKAFQETGVTSRNRR